nr:hypothetical protein [Rhizobium esperanzae]
MYRRRFLKTLAVSAAVVSPILNSIRAHANHVPADLVIGKRTLDVNGKAATILGLANRSGKPGLVLDPGTDLDIRLLYETSEDTLIHRGRGGIRYRQSRSLAAPLPPPVPHGDGDDDVHRLRGRDLISKLGLPHPASSGDPGTNAPMQG